MKLCCPAKYCIPLLLFFALSGYATAQMAVEDKNNRRQVERMVFMHWEKFKPAWYFLLLHARYKKKDRRIILQLAPALAALKENRRESGEEKEDIKVVHDDLVARQAAIIAESHYHLYFKKEFDRFDEEYGRLYLLCIKNKVPGGELSRFTDERAMLKEYLRAVREGNITKGESAAAMADIQQDYKQLLEAMRATLNAWRLKNKVAHIKMNP